MDWMLKIVFPKNSSIVVWFTIFNGEMFDANFCGFSRYLKTLQTNAQTNLSPSIPHLHTHVHRIIHPEIKRELHHLNYIYELPHIWTALPASLRNDNNRKKLCTHNFVVSLQNSVKFCLFILDDNNFFSLFLCKSLLKS